MWTAHKPNAAASYETEADTEFDGLLQRRIGRRMGNPLHGVAIGRIESVGNDGPLVHLDFAGDAPLQAQASCPLPADCAGRDCAVLFVDGDPAQPLIIGLLLELPKGTETTTNAHEPNREVRVNGERLIIEAEQELELRCGESIILLQRDGCIEIRGNYVTSQATATQRIRGGSVHMN